MSGARWDASQRDQVQRLALSGFDFDHSAYLVLAVDDAVRARAFLAALLVEGGVTFGTVERGASARDAEIDTAVSIGFTFAGLEALDAPPRYLDELRTKAAAYCEGAAPRSVRLGDAGASAPEAWPPKFRSTRAHVLIALHGCSLDAIAKRRASMAGRPDARAGLTGWDDVDWASHLVPDKSARVVHFGYRDGIARPQVVEDGAAADPRMSTHRAGELLLGYENDARFNRWDDGLTDAGVAQFFRNGSFAALRKIEQDVPGFEYFVAEQAPKAGLSADELKAKLCGRWPDGHRVMAPGHGAQRVDESFDFSDDTAGLGCPFGAHIRRMNPRGDPIAPPRLRPLFRRGMPYGRAYPTMGPPERAERGLMGLFFCASIDDQFETVMSQWAEKNPMGPPNTGDSKDPLIGHHDEDGSSFAIPRLGGGALRLSNFKPFVTTRGALYAFFPSRAAIDELTRGAARTRERERSGAAPRDREPGPAARGAPKAPPFESSTRDAAAADRFCDIVMEGGITSGIIYTSAVAELAKTYRFSSIGGSSIGAFAAALTAAAEYRRRHGSTEGFEMLEKLPDQLSAEDDKQHTLLRRLFQPEPRTRRLFEIFLATLDKRSGLTRFTRGLLEAVRQYRVASTWACVAVACAFCGPLILTWLGLSRVPELQWPWSALGMVPMVVALLCLLVVVCGGTVLFGVIWDLARGLVPNGYGLCRGWSRKSKLNLLDPNLNLNLAGFLHASIQKVAGLHPIDDRPLTFANLRQAPGAASDIFPRAPGAAVPPSINLQVYATNLAHSRPYRFPLVEADGMERLFFKVDELARYFPEPVIRHLEAFGTPYTQVNPPIGKEDGYIELPTENLPIVVAARLAMSFPLLISAVPLWAIDHERPAADRAPARCWMSDGGLCSNFPIHLFDSFVPRWPTFGISLQNRTPFRPQQCIWLPQTESEGRADIWDRFDERSSSLPRLGGFLISLWWAAWRWNDMTMMRMPGVRDRVVRVYLEKGEGGVNIKMSRASIEDLARKYGKAAGQAFVAKFAGDAPDGWPAHRWTRFNRLLIAMRDQIEGVTLAMNSNRYSQRMCDQINDVRVQGLRSAARDPDAAARIKARTDDLLMLARALTKLEQAFAQTTADERSVMVPRPVMRIRDPS